MNVGVSQRDFQTIREHRSKLERVFRRYCGGGKMASRSKVKSNKTPHAVGTLSMTGFHEILNTAGRGKKARSSKDQDNVVEARRQPEQEKQETIGRFVLVVVLEAKSYQSIGTKFVSKCSVRKTRSLLI